MAQKTYWASALLLFSLLASGQTNRCDNLYAKVTYSLSHTKKAMTATNFEHQMYYAERALTALEKSKEYQAECGCEKTKNKTLDIVEVLEKAIEPNDWEAGRFYTKKSMGMVNELITMIDECTQNDSAPTVVVDSDNATIENEAYGDETDTHSSEQDDEMIEVFNANAQVRLDSAKMAIEKLILLSKTYNPNSSETNDDSSNLVTHQREYLENAKKILKEGLEALEKK